MFVVSGYHIIEQVYESEQSLIFRATRKRDDVPVIIKALKDLHPPVERIARFKREFELLQTFEGSGVVDAYDLSNEANHWLFVQEDFGGESLTKLNIAGNIDIETFLTLAEDLVGHVAVLHRQEIIHKDINPSNIVLNQRTGTLKLIDLGIATRLPREPVAFDHPKLIEGTPAYMSPEQTGRINHPLDHRTDLYSLGCSFYELLTGHPPFQADELTELLHCHLARTPEPLSSQRADLPDVLSDIVGKLLSKHVGDRYQTALGLQADIARCRRQWQQSRQIEPFSLAARDVAQQLSAPARLYGREREIAELLSTFERASAGASQLLLVSGYPGIGKSALVKELYKPVTHQNGYFVTGKFDQFQRDTPYGPILHALDRLVSQILIEPEDEITRWSTAIASATGHMIAPLANLIPRLGLLCERPPAAASLPPSEFRLQFMRAVARFIQVFAKADHPLVIFIDDLQWADHASLDLLKHLMMSSSISNLLLIGAYRHAEVPPAHPLRAALDDIQESGARFRDIRLSSLTIADTAELLADTLHSDLDAISDLAKLTHEKTDGNPFFIQTLLDMLVTDEVVSFNHELGCWSWDSEHIRVLDSSDNVVDMLLSNFERLPDVTRALLGQAACIGNHFALGLLAAVTERSAFELTEALMPALAERYLIPTSGDYRLMEASSAGLEDLHQHLQVSYKFAHDRVQQAAYSLTGSASRARTHLELGRGMCRYYGADPHASERLEIINQLNQARVLITEPAEQRESAEMNLAAGRHAKAAVAHGAALTYFEAGLLFLAGDSESTSLSASGHERAFETDYEVAMALTGEGAEAAYLAARFEQANEYIELQVARSRSVLDRVKAVEVQLASLTAQNRLPDAVNVARQFLRALSLGIELPEKTTDAIIESMFAEVAREMGTRTPRDLADLPEMSAEEPAAAMRILTNMFNPVFQTDAELSRVVAAEMVLLTLRYGLNEQSGNGFIFYGVSLCARDKFARGNEFGRLAEHIVEKHGRTSQIPDLAVLGGFYIFHWERPLVESVQKMRDGYRAGLESGYTGSGANCLQCSTAMKFFTGGDLARIDTEYTENARALASQGHTMYLIWLRQYHQCARNFMGLNDNPTLLKGEVYDEVAELVVHRRNQDLTSEYNLNFNRAELTYHFHEYRESLRCSDFLEQGNQAGSVLLPMAVFFHCLALLAVHDDSPQQEQSALLDKAEGMVARMKLWGESSPENYAHKYHLMRAELHRAKREDADGRAHYDLAVDLARKHEFCHEEALALERAALFFLDRQQGRVAGYYMRDAHYTYGVWGAAAKQKFLRREYGYLLEREIRGRARRTNKAMVASSTSSTSTSEIADLDLVALLAATRALTRETDLDRLLRAVMRVSLENTGAEVGFLILLRGSQLLVKVHGELGQHEVFETLSHALQDQAGLAHSVVQYVARTAEPVLLNHAVEEGMFLNDAHIRETACKSLLCVPILNQGSLVAITYLENNRTTSVFNEDRLDLLTLLMGQAATSIENALLKQSEVTGGFSFRVGGSLSADSPAYVSRSADALLTKHIRAGEYCYVFNARQMGKSSLRIRTVRVLEQAGYVCASIDVTSVSSREIRIDQWYAGICRILVGQLGLKREFNLAKWWVELAELSPIQRLKILFDDVILERIDKPIVIFIDEIDAVLSLDISLDEFFALLRMFYNSRADDPRYERVRVVLFGVATPTDLIRDPRRTPFNIGRSIPLSPFRYDEARTLLPGLHGIGEPDRLLKAILDWSGGQPFLTQKLCRLLTEDESRPPTGAEAEWVTKIVRQQVIDKWRYRDDPEHLKTIESRVLSGSTDVHKSLLLYQQILEHGEVEANNSSLEISLQLSGLVTSTFGKLHVSNPIYASVFDHRWLEARLTELSDSLS